MMLYCIIEFSLNKSEMNEGGATKETKVAAISAWMAAREDTNQGKNQKHNRIFLNWFSNILIYYLNV